MKSHTGLYSFCLSCERTLKCIIHITESTFLLYLLYRTSIVPKRTPQIQYWNSKINHQHKELNFRCFWVCFWVCGDYIIPVCQDEISPRPAGTDLTLRLHVEIKFRRKAGQFSTWHLFRFACNFFEFFFVNMSVYEIENPQISID